MKGSTAAASAPAAEPTRNAYGPAEEPLALSSFLRRHAEFDAGRLDRLRATEYGRLDAEGQIYLDYTGGGLYAASQLSAHVELLRGSVLGNPHSLNPTSAASTELIERARTAVLRYFNASSEYRVIFTPNATGALKLVGEAYPFGTGSHFLLTSDNHNSVNGLREFARAWGATTTYLPSTSPSLRVDESRLDACLGRADRGRSNLFAYPAQSNFSGAQHPLEWIATAQTAGWDVLVDGAAFVPSNRLDLSEWKPDFVPISLYKLLGYPTGVGCLLVREDALARLRRPWFAGGTISAVSVHGDWHAPAEGEAAFEDGTLNYLALPAVEQGLRFLEDIGIDTIHTRVRCLTDWLLRGARGAAARKRKPGRADPRPADDRPARRNDRVQLPSPGRTAPGRPDRRRARCRARNLVVDRLLLQPRCGRARLRRPARGPAATSRVACLRRPPPSARRGERRRHSSLARARDDVPGRLSLHALRVDVRRELKRMMGLEPTTFCMASRRSSQLSYIRVGRKYSDGQPAASASSASFTSLSASLFCSRRTAL